MDTRLNRIRDYLIETESFGKYNPRHILAWMYSENDTLDNLTQIEFANEIELACKTIFTAGIELSEDLAQSFGL